MALNPAQQVLQVATGYMASSALYVTLALNIPDHFADGAKTTTDLAAAGDSVLLLVPAQSPVLGR